MSHTTKETRTKTPSRQAVASRHDHPDGDPPPCGTGLRAKPAAPRSVSPNLTSEDYSHGEGGRRARAKESDAFRTNGTTTSWYALEVMSSSDPAGPEHHPNSRPRTDGKRRPTRSSTSFTTTTGRRRPDATGRPETRARRDGSRARSDTTVGPETTARPAGKARSDATVEAGTRARPDDGASTNSNAGRSSQGVRGRTALPSSPSHPSGRRGRKTGGGAPDSPDAKAMMSWRSFLKTNGGEDDHSTTATATTTTRRGRGDQEQQAGARAAYSPWVEPRRRPRQKAAQPQPHGQDQNTSWGRPAHAPAVLSPRVGRDGHPDETRPEVPQRRTRNHGAPAWSPHPPGSSSDVDVEAQRRRQQRLTAKAAGAAGVGDPGMYGMPRGTKLTPPVQQFLSHLLPGTRLTPQQQQVLMELQEMMHASAVELQGRRPRQPQRQSPPAVELQAERPRQSQQQPPPAVELQAERPRQPQQQPAPAVEFQGERPRQPQPSPASPAAPAESDLAQRMMREMTSGTQKGLGGIKRGLPQPGLFGQPQATPASIPAVEEPSAQPATEAKPEAPEKKKKKKDKTLWGKAKKKAKKKIKKVVKDVTGGLVEAKFEENEEGGLKIGFQPTIQIGSPKLEDQPEEEEGGEEGGDEEEEDDDDDEEQSDDDE